MSTLTRAAADRPLRRDAAENRERLLRAAAEVFEKHGIEAGVEEIARVAGVGMGTLYRRFPTKDALIAELVQDMLDTMIGLAKDAMEQPDGRGLECYLETSGAYQAAHRGCLPRLWNLDESRASVQRLRRMVASLLEDAKRHGQVRSDLASTDVTMVMWSVRGVIETTRDVAPEAWRRHLELVIAGLRPTASSLGFAPLTQAQVDQVHVQS